MYKAAGGVTQHTGRLSCCWDKIPGTCNLAEKRFILHPGFRVFSLWSLAPRQKHHGKKVQWRKSVQLTASGKHGAGEVLQRCSPQVPIPWPHFLQITAHLAVNSSLVNPLMRLALSESSHFSRSLLIQSSWHTRNTPFYSPLLSRSAV